FGSVSVEQNAEAATGSFQMVWQSALVGDIEREMTIPLRLDSGQWRIEWDASLVLPELAGGNMLRIANYTPARGEIYDRNGQPLARFSDAYALGIVPARINPDTETAMLRALEQLTGRPHEYIESLYKNYGLEDDLYIPFTDLPADVLDPVLASLSYESIFVQPFAGRYYTDAGLASQTVGYLSAIQPQEIDAYERRGYFWTERVPRDGVELKFEPFLAGTRGGALYLDHPDGAELALLAERDPAPADDLYLTIDIETQRAAQDAIFGFKGAVVVLERNTGRILAIASAPEFNPNLFEPTNPNAAWVSPLNDPLRPLVNRATQGQYPLGSVFKIVTMAAALESGLYTAESTYDCQHTFTELGDPILYDWTYADDKPPSGLLTLPEGLMRSCNPWFFHIGLDLFNQGLTTAVHDMAVGFGLGSPANPEQLYEQAGVVPEPASPLDATNLAIGQGDLLVTPLQVAAFVAAVGNGGTLYRPQIVERIVGADGTPVAEFAPQIDGALPVAPENLAIIRDAMEQVIRNERGTAYDVLGAFPVRIAGKTGTAESGQIKPHAWFIAYSDEGRIDKPDIAVAAVVENIGEGSDFAAPIVRRVLDLYFFGEPRNLNAWEIRYGVPRSLVETEETLAATATAEFEATQSAEATLAAPTGEATLEGG
ncbi:MAG: penicillin-binding transpeptidase domain-containing protein, partial [Anaerolineales bacterium]